MVSIYGVLTAQLKHGNVSVFNPYQLFKNRIYSLNRVMFPQLTLIPVITFDDI